MGYLGPRMAHPDSCGSVARIVLQFFTMKEGKRDMEIILIVF